MIFELVISMKTFDFDLLIVVYGYVLFREETYCYVKSPILMVRGTSGLRWTFVVQSAICLLASRLKIEKKIYTKLVFWLVFPSFQLWISGAKRTTDHMNLDFNFYWLTKFQNRSYGWFSIRSLISDITFQKKFLFKFKTF